MGVQTVTTNWKEGTVFESSLPSGAAITMSGSGPKPLEVMFASLGSCAGLTLLSLASKLRIPLRRVEIDVRGELAEGKVQVMKAAHLKFRLWGDALDRGQVERLLQMTEKYCPVYGTLVSAGPIDYSYEIDPA
ncbi:MAG: OsmC family protein [Firmicutes bacterium]|jgi:putative redox protein|nr:OsmC family protein [Bacillota bacterium]